MKKIKLIGRLGRGKHALVDDEDYEWLSQYRWYLDYGGYALSYVKENGKWKNVRMHRLIMNAPKDKEIDHKNTNKLDNQKYNLRLCSPTENCRNFPKRAKASSIFKGVSFYKRDSNWSAQIHLPGHKKVHLGFFSKEELAARAYDTAAKELFGEFARLNFPDPINSGESNAPSPV